MVFNFLRLSATGQSAQYFGAQNAKGLLQVLLQGGATALVLGALLWALQPLWLGLSLRLMGGTAEVTEAAQAYIQIRLLAAPLLLANYVLVGWFIGVHKPRIVLLLLLVNNGMNMLLDVLFVLGFDWQLEGVAWATVISEFIAFLLALWFAKTHPLVVAAWPDRYGIFNLLDLKQYFVLNTDLFIRTVALMAVFLFFTSQGARYSDEVLAANAVLLNIYLLCAFALDGFAHAAEALVGKAMGHQNRQQLIAALRLTGLWALITACGISVLLAIFGKFWILWMSSIPEVVVLANQFLNWIIVIPILAVAAFWLDGVFVGATLSRDMRDAMLLSTCLFFLLWYMAQPWENHGLWAAYAGFAALRGLLLGYRLRQRLPNLIKAQL
jgi:MATE family multidrug resistance protein